MCGITGIYAFNQLGRLNMINLAAATDAMASRGPDMQLTYHDEFVGLGHRRLSVIDLSPEASQPMEDHTGRYVLIFNGEVYNYRQLRSQLEVHFATQSDTEVLLYLLIQRGIEALKDVNGFFAFAFYDKETRKLLIARDRFGIKPVHYYADQDKLIFASEMKSILRYGIDRQLNPAALQTYFQLNYIPGPHSILEGCRKLLPGTYIEIVDGNWQVDTYFELGVEELSEEDNVVDTFSRLFEESVRDRLVADVPVGTFLSGGLDSSAVTAMARKHKEDLSTFSIGFSDARFFDESKYAETVAKKLGTNHHAVMLTTRDMYDALHSVLDYLDEPFADSSALAVNILCRETRQHVTVALSGDGADELLGGYNKHEALWRMMHPGFREKAIGAFGPLWKIMPTSRSSGTGNLFRKAARFAEHYAKGRTERYVGLASFLDKAEVDRLLEDRFRTSGALDIHINADFNSILDADLRLVLPNDMLTKVDMMSMAHSLEVRVPFLDHRLVAFVRSLPSDYKIRGAKRKILLKEAMKNVLPNSIIHRKKHGFEVPVLQWFRREMKDLIVKDLLHDDFIESQGVFDPSEVRRYRKKIYSSNPGDAHATVWALVVFQWWYRKHFSD